MWWYLCACIQWICWFACFCIEFDVYNVTHYHCLAIVLCLPHLSPTHQYLTKVAEVLFAPYSSQHTDLNMHSHTHKHKNSVGQDLV